MKTFQSFYHTLFASCIQSGLAISNFHAQSIAESLFENEFVARDVSQMKTKNDFTRQRKKEVSLSHETAVA